jgi:hypothetical protein
MSLILAQIPGERAEPLRGRILLLLVITSMILLPPFKTKASLGSILQKPLPLIYPRPTTSSLLGFAPLNHKVYSVLTKIIKALLMQFARRRKSLHRHKQSQGGTGVLSNLRSVHIRRIGKI